MLDTRILPITGPETDLVLEAPGGLVTVRATCRNGKAEHITLTNIPSYADKLGASLEVEGVGTLTVDTAYGGDSFVIVDAAALGFAIVPDEARDLAEMGMRITAAADEQLGFQLPGDANWDHISFCQFAGSLTSERGVLTGAMLWRSDQVRLTAPRLERGALHGWPCCVPEDRCSRATITWPDRSSARSFSVESRAMRRWVGNRRSSLPSAGALGSLGLASLCSIPPTPGPRDTVWETRGRRSANHLKLRLLSQSDIRQALTLRRAIDLMEHAFVALSQKAIDVPVRTNVASQSGTMLYKPALMQSSQVFGMKAVSVFPSNADRGLPVTTGLMLVNDSETGLPLAIMDAAYLTALRTGAATGLATRLLANPTTTVAALFGTGGQAPCQLQAMLEVLPLERVYVFSRRAENAEKFCRDHQQASGDCVLKAALKEIETQAVNDASFLISDHRAIWMQLKMF